MQVANIDVRGNTSESRLLGRVRYAKRKRHDMPNNANEEGTPGHKAYTMSALPNWIESAQRRFGAQTLAMEGAGCEKLDHDDE